MAKNEKKEETQEANKALGVRKDGKVYKVELVEYKLDGTCSVTELYTATDSIDAFDRFKIISSKQMQNNGF